MRSLTRNLCRLRFFLGAAIASVALTGCEYDVPITAGPTRATDATLVGTWRSLDGKEVMIVRRIDEQKYVLSYDGDLYAAYHSDLDGAPFVSVLHLDPDNRKYAYLTWTLSDNSRRLLLRLVSSKVISPAARDSAAIQEQLRKNLKTPGLFESEHHYTREP